jgi:phosphohistidine swiveling domain-containing protein
LGCIEKVGDVGRNRTYDFCLADSYLATWPPHQDEYSPTFFWYKEYNAITALASSLKQFMKNLNPADWEKYWSLNMSGLGCSLFSLTYMQAMPKTLGVGFTESLVFTKEGYSSCYFLSEDRKKFAEGVIQKFAQNPESIKDFCVFLQQEADTFLTVIPSLEPTSEGWEQFKAAFLHYSCFHIIPRHLADFLPAETITPSLPHLSEARLYVEHLYSESEKVLHGFAETWSTKSGYTPEELLCCSFSEIERYLESGEFPEHAVLQDRQKQMVCTGENESVTVGNSQESASLEQQLTQKQDVTEIRGTSAFKGKATGTVRVVFNPHAVQTFNEGDILVTGMTRPDYLPLMQKAAAIITDTGGLLCHAAIVARELKKTCIIGTKIATSTLENGDSVEVDADNGIVTRK